MSFEPFVPTGGLSGWVTLRATLPSQKAAFNRSQPIQSDTEYFFSKFGAIESAEDVVSDRRTLRVILGAYGLSEDIDNRFFIKKILTEGVASQSSLANKLSDRRYRALARDFDFSVNPPSHKTQLNLVTETASRYRDKAFEIKVGEQSADMRLALGFAGEMRTLVNSTKTNPAAWFQVLGSPPVRKVFQTALGLPDAFSQLDVDDQHKRIQDQAERVFGTSDMLKLSLAPNVENITRRFLIMREVASVSQSSSLQTALVLLQSRPPSL